MAHASDRPPRRQDRFSWISHESEWPLKVLLAAVLLIPGLLFLALALHQRDSLLREGEHLARRTAAALTEHALKVLETQSLVLEHINERLHGMPWSAIERDDRLQRSLDAHVQKFPQIAAIWLIDASGRLRQGSPRRAAAPLQDGAIEASEYFRAHRDGAAGGVAVSGPVQASTGDRFFTVSVRREGSDGAFDGVIAVAVDISYFTTFWRQFAPSVDYVIPLMRADGTMLVRFPAAEQPARLQPTAPYMRQIAAAPEGGFYMARSAVDGVERMNAYQRVGDHPLYVSFSAETAAILAPWRRQAALYALLALITTAALAAGVLLAIRQTRTQRRAATAWRESAERNAAEIQRRERAEAQLVQAQKMEAVGQLTGGVAHDFNNLLHAMTLNVELAERVSAAGPAVRYLDNVRRGIDRAAQLTRQLTAFSRRQRLEPENFALAARLVGMADLLQRTLGGTIALAIDVGQDVWPVYADPAQTDHALLNLAVNARDAMPGGGRLSITARNLGLAEARGDLAAGDYVEVAVTDTGTGIAPDVIGRVFEPFFTTKEVGKGSGLGLSMVHGFVSQSGGAVAMESQPGRGTTVRLMLPRGRAVPQDARPVEPGPAPASSAAAGRILLVDDDSLVRASMLLALREAGYTVQEAAGGAEALQMMREAPPDLLLTDYAMPGMTGGELAARARALYPRLPVVLVTGYARPGLGMEPVPDVDVVLHKPCRRADLLEHLARLLARAPRARGTSAAIAAVDQAV